MYQSLAVIDDFYPNPHGIRQTALSCDYPEVTGVRTYPGCNSAQQFLLPGINDAVSRVLGEPLVGDPDPKSTHGRFRITHAGDKCRYLVHVDPTAVNWVGVIYLNEPGQCQGGTAFYRHKGLNSDRTPLSEAELRAYGPASVGELLQQDGNNPDIWEHLMTVPMRFNRLIIYRPWMWHSAGAAFGGCRESGRLIQLVAFQSKAQ